MRQRNLTGYAVLVLVLATWAWPAGAGDPELFNVFTPRVIESFQSVTQSSQRMEDGLAGPLDQLKKQMATYDESGCLRGGTEDEDVGCISQFTAIRDTYAGFLEELRVALPEIDEKISFATERMKANVQKSANRASPEDLWETLKGAKPLAISSRGPLSGRMKRILDAIHLPGARVSPAKLSLDIYADLAATQEILALIQAAVVQQEMLMQLPDEALMSYGSEFAATIGQVQLAIFGEEPIYPAEGLSQGLSVEDEIPEDWGG